ncbi:hypothetical protein C1Y26_34240 [Pseudomonas sp. MPR-R2A7]|nr:hypothetical protein C1Y23_34165 [Pseudomonas sp. GW460-12]PMX27409.1 hypothetical protein C1Y24_34340 [Pseudomonas sp. MPR-R2A4]PMX30762.1 hypothetical protein C1Y26_34240 [Pseudomonas sp. MPR-R2A7]PMX45366.1 hypothetical protein C1Y17_34450 [Pseudomonas sp. MPR-R2A6]PMX79898.1 hypothetical protein C1Y21_33855 [Pseudomonas sp. MPR-R2A3]PMY03464.1 hypothetical protein C1Y22_34610 [Pseudomonas sp. MPR-R2A5]PNA19433.1 hypothetical protein C1Y16_34290 [Pseudomonas sp. MPR-ANB1]PNA37170.1 hyp
MRLWQTHCYRGQAPSHIWSCIHQVDLSLPLLWLWLPWRRPELCLVYSVENVGGAVRRFDLPPMRE